MESTVARGPKAPKDPTKKRSVIYIMLDDAIEGRPNGHGGFSDVNFLNGSIKAILMVSRNLYAHSFSRLDYTVGILDGRNSLRNYYLRRFGYVLTHCAANLRVGCRVDRAR